MGKQLKYIAIALLALVTLPAYATDYGNYDHVQGNDFQCATGVQQQLECQIENILKFFFPQMIDQQKTTNDRLQTIINNQNKEIAEQQQQIDLLNQLVNHFVNKTIAKCVKSGTGILCG